MYSSPLNLSFLPHDILLVIFSHLRTQRLNALRSTCRRFHILIDGNQDFFYRRRVVKTELHVGKTKMKTAVEYRRSSITLYFVHDTCVDACWSSQKEYEYKEDLTKQTFLSQSIEQCFRIIAARSGGINLTLCGKLTPEGIDTIRTLLNRTRSLVLTCRMRWIPRELALEALCMKPKILKIDDCCIFDMLNQFDDQFCQETAFEQLNLCGFHAIPLNDHQMITLVNRPTLKSINIQLLKGPSLHCIRRVIQSLLHSKVKFKIMFTDYNRDEAMDILTRSMAQERIEMSNDILDSKRHSLLKFTLNGRLVTVTVGICGPVLIHVVA